VDDQPEVLLPLKKIFKGLNCKVSTLSTFNAAVEGSKSDLIILDWNLGELTGDDFLKFINRGKSKISQHLVIYSSDSIDKIKFTG